MKKNMIEIGKWGSKNEISHTEVFVFPFESSSLSSFYVVSDLFDVFFETLSEKDIKKQIANTKNSIRLYSILTVYLFKSENKVYDRK